MLNELLARAAAAGASDLHLRADARPALRLRGELTPIDDAAPLSSAAIRDLAVGMMTAAQRARFDADLELDYAYSVPGLGRFRCNAFQQRGTVGLAIRVVPGDIRSVDALELPTVISDIASEMRGLVLVTGTTGSGKSTTLASMIATINATRRAHILTVEDPIEFVHSDLQSVISQREVGVDTESFAHALRSALRQDPDVILVGEMRDYETIETALVAAETGHLVFSTLHTLDAVETVSRIISVFPPHHQSQVRLQLAGVLRAVISQRLLARADGMGRVPAVEVMRVTPFIRECIIDPTRTTEIRDAIAGGTSQYGMQTFDQSIYGLLKRGLVTEAEALRWVTNADEFRLRLQGVSMTRDANRDSMASQVLGGQPDITRFGK